jgi:hypothetical protein
MAITGLKMTTEVFFKYCHDLRQILADRCVSYFGILGFYQATYSPEALNKNSKIDCFIHQWLMNTENLL